MSMKKARGTGTHDVWGQFLVARGVWRVEHVNRKEEEEARRAGRDQVANSLASVILRSLDFIHNGE